MKFQLNYLLFICCLMAFQQANAQTYQRIESAEYDHARHRFLISNDNSILSRTADGSLSFFGSNAAASYGMEVMNNTLFAIKSTTIRGYDLDTEEEVMSINIPQASFLNGLAADGKNMLYATDFGSGRIYRIDVADYANPTFSVLINNSGGTPNGITYDSIDNRLVFVNWGSNAPIKAIDLNNNNELSTLLTTNLRNIDGIDMDPAGNFYVVSWSPARLTRYDHNFTDPPMTITAPGLSSPADICYANEIDTLAIPNSGNQTVTFVGFESTTSSSSLSPAKFDFSISPNPLSSASVIRYQLAKASQVKIELLDIQGRSLAVLVDSQQQQGSQQVLMAGLSLPAGTYFCRLTVDGKQTTKGVQRY